MRILTGAAIVTAVLLTGACSEQPAPAPAAAARGESFPDGEPTARERLGPVAARIWVRPTEPRFGDRLTLWVELEAGEDARLEEPAWGARFGHFRVRDRRELRDAGAGRRRWRFEVEAERTGTGFLRLPAARFTIVEGEGEDPDELRTLQLGALPVEVAGLGEDERPDLAAFGEVLPPVPLPAPERETPSWWFLVIGAASASAVLAVMLRARGRRGPAAAPPVPPGEEARRALEALLASGLLVDGRVDVFYLRLTGIVRRYIERTTGLHAPEQTTEEFLRAMDGHEAIAPPQRRDLAAFLVEADLVKFAGVTPGEDDVQRAVAAARRFCGLAEEVD